MIKKELPASDSLKQRLDVEFALEAAGLGVWELDPNTNLVNWDDTCRALFGLARDNKLPYEQAIRHIHPEDVERVDQAVQRAMRPQSGGQYDVTYRVIGADDGQLRWVRFIGKSYFHADGQIYRFAGVAMDITRQREAQQRLEESQREIVSLFEEAPVGIATINADDQLHFQSVNPFYGELVGRRPEALVDKPLLEALPELVGQGFDNLLREVIASGVAFTAKEIAVDLVRNNQLQTIYVDLVYQPRFAADGAVGGILVVATDVTQQVRSRRQVEASEAKLRSLIQAAPAGIGLFVGRDLLIEMPNQTFIDIVGKGPGVEGLPLREAMPELLTEGQPFLRILDEVFTTGVPFSSPASLVKIVQNGVLRANYYNISYVPIRDTSNTVYAILDIAIDVTQQVRAQQSLKESQDILQAMIEVAELGTYSIDLATNQLINSPRVAGWYGLPELTDVASSMSRIRPADQSRVSQVLAGALEPGSSGTYTVEYMIHNPLTDQEYRVQTIGQVRWDLDGQPTRIDGLVRDITLQHQQQLALEWQVKQRTQELAKANEALSSSNEEYVAINEELSESNSLLMRSNDNLQTFAYVASHDLQEPLRKVQQFGDLLKTRFSDTVQGEELAYVERMQATASHMSRLVKDLLSFSRISTRRNSDEPVDLNQVVARVLGVLDLRIAETATQVRVDSLPTVPGDAAQLSQLFQNLLDNAIKFQQLATTPVIEISSQLVAIDQLPTSIKPARKSPMYQCISVADNGIGFEEKYLDRIFQVFQRLHGKTAFAGTGVGLAICEKVVANHGGVITARSQPGHGATFAVYLPA